MHELTPVLYVGQTNAPIICQTLINPIGATVAEIRWRKPDQTSTGSWPAEIEYKQLKYLPLPGDLDQVGFYQVQPFFMLDGLEHIGPYATFEVKPVIPAPSS